MTKGKQAETAALEFFEHRGFRVLGRNVRFGALEIDLVLREGDLLVACEVRYRARGGHAGALASITRVKRERMLRAAERLYGACIKDDPSIGRFRIDVCVVHFGPDGPSVEHFPGAVTAD